MSSNPRRIDVHHHVLPPKFMAHLRSEGIAWTGGPVLFDWSVPIALEMMERQGIATAIASIVPSVHWGNQADATRFARYSNDYLADVVRADPVHFGGLGTLPLPDVAEALNETRRIYDELNLDGLILFSSQANQYLGDPAHEELYQELDRRRSVVLIHPTTAPPGATVPKITVPWGIVEFIADTSRAVANLLYNGVLERYPNIRFIVSHAGGAIPYIALRMALSGDHIPGMKDHIPKGTLHYLQRLYYDTTLSTSEQVLAALGQFVPKEQVLFGSDYPLVPEEVVGLEGSMLEKSRVLDAAARKAIYRDNALALFPRFAT
jgi:predicted TIM-barrel fold metal-dependent hydrolase